MKNIIEILDNHGPLTGKELLYLSGLDEFTLWAACQRSDHIITRVIGQRYLRLDKNVEEFARLSPSIMREFYGYTIIGTPQFSLQIHQKAELLQLEISEISKRKFDLAQSIFKRLVDSHPERDTIKNHVTIMIAGDVVYSMAHAEPRPECSTGELVRGSDLDVIIVSEGLPPELSESLDATIYDEKYKLLISPASREEIDYIVKDISRVIEQLEFKDFKAMVAAKILNEADFLYGSLDIFNKVKTMLAEKGIPEKLQALQKQAQFNREQAESYLLEVKDTLTEEESMKLFYTAEEKEEIF